MHVVDSLSSKIYDFIPSYFSCWYNFYPPIYTSCYPDTSSVWFLIVGGVDVVSAVERSVVAWELPLYSLILLGHFGMCDLFWNRTDPMAKPFPTGSQVTTTHSTNSTIHGIIANVPMPQPLVHTVAFLPSGPTPTKYTYVIHLDNITTVESTFEDLTQTRKSDTSLSPHEPASATFEGLPRFLQDKSKVTMDHTWSFVKGYIHLVPENGFHFAIRRNLHSNKIDRLIPLPNFKQT